MNYFLNELNKEKQKQYEDARDDLLKARYSFSQLDDMQKQQLISEFVGVEATISLFSLVRQLLG